MFFVPSMMYTLDFPPIYAGPGPVLDDDPRSLCSSSFFSSSHTSVFSWLYLALQSAGMAGSPPSPRQPNF